MCVQFGIPSQGGQTNTQSNEHGNARHEDVAIGVPVEQPGVVHVPQVVFDNSGRIAALGPLDMSPVYMKDEVRRDAWHIGTQNALSMRFECLFF